MHNHYTTLLEKIAHLCKNVVEPQPSFLLVAESVVTVLPLCFPGGCLNILWDLTLIQETSQPAILRRGVVSPIHSSEPLGGDIVLNANN